jgi:hypothetical protein
LEENWKHMAMLNGLLGTSHVNYQTGSKIWGGYIIFVPDPVIIKRFERIGSEANWYYEGPIATNGKYFMGEGKVLINKITVSPAELIAEFTGQGELLLQWCLARMPADFTLTEKISA